MGVAFLAIVSFDSFGQHLLRTCQNNGINTLRLQSGTQDVCTIPASSPEAIQTGNSYSPHAGESVMPGTGWELKFSASGKVFKDVSFANTQVGYIVTELGSVYKSTDGGDTWSSVMNLGFPYYWYGVDALSPDTVIISGFNNQGPITGGVVRWTYDGGSNWNPDINLNIPVSAVGWLDRVHFFNANTGIVVNSFSGGCWFTVNGGKDAASWTYITINSDLAWFAGNIDAQPSGHIFATGIHLAQSVDYGANWVSGPCADYLFDSGIDFTDENNLYGWTGGGQISAPVAGWVCRTTDGGLSWSPRLNTFPYPIRALHFLDENRGWAVGGNLYDEAGGIYSTTDGGLTWTLDVSTLAEMFSMEFKAVSADSLDVWCVGSTGGSTGYKGKLYKARIAFQLTGTGHQPALPESGILLDQNVPNPFGRVTTIGFAVPQDCRATLKVFDVTGRAVATLLDGKVEAGHNTFQFDGRGLPGGVYYYCLQTGNFTETRKCILK